MNFEGDFTKNRKKLPGLFLEFARFGCFTFGGGWSIIAQMQQMYVEKRKEMTSQELLDLTSVAKSLPGTMISNVAMLYGYRTAGLLGGFTAVFGMVLPPLAVIIGISFCYRAFRSNLWVSAAMEGMQAAVVPIIFSAAVNLAKGSVPYSPCVLILLVSVGLYLFTDINPIFLVLMGVASGLVIGSIYGRRKTDGIA
ncbi:MAG: chromate transporter [Faecousia sp.]